MRLVKYALLTVLVLALPAAAWVGYQLRNRPDLAAYSHLLLPAAEPRAGALRVRFLGVSTLLFDDGETAILTDGFFTRPPLRQVIVGRVQPDSTLIADVLDRAGARRLAAVIVMHSHYDHAMDAPEVARRSGAMLVGSESTANVGRGWGLPEDRIRTIAGGERLQFGRFTVTLLRSRHVPVATADDEAIAEPLTPPARASDYREGGSYSVLIEHAGRTVLVQGSAGFIGGALAGQDVDVAFLGIGALGRQGESYLSDYWHETVTVPGTRRVIPIHWDDFSRPLTEPLVPLPRLLDDLDRTMRFFLARSQGSGVDLRLAPEWVPIDPFAGL